MPACETWQNFIGKLRQTTWVHEKGFRLFALNIKLSRAQTELVEFVEHFVFLMR
jgi:hypothetical protein